MPPKFIQFEFRLVAFAARWWQRRQLTRGGSGIAQRQIDAADEVYGECERRRRFPYSECQWRFGGFAETILPRARDVNSVSFQQFVLPADRLTLLI